MRATLVPVFLGLLACSSDEPKRKAEGAFDLNGTWRGTWKSSTNPSRGGGAEISIVHDGTHVSGNAIFNGDPCFGGGKLSATVADAQLTGSVTAGTVQVQVDAVASDSALDGTYSVPGIGPCVADNGTFSVAPTSP